MALPDKEMDETTIDRDAMGRLAKALAFTCGTDHPTTIALKAAAESGVERDIKNARTLFLPTVAWGQEALERTDPQNQSSAR